MSEPTPAGGRVPLDRAAAVRGPEGQWYEVDPDRWVYVRGADRDDWDARNWVPVGEPLHG